MAQKEKQPGKLLAVGREIAGFTQGEAAEAVGVSVSAWRKYENGTRALPFSVLIDATHKLGLDEIIYEEIYRARELEILRNEHQKSIPPAEVAMIKKLAYINERTYDEMLVRLLRAYVECLKVVRSVSWFHFLEYSHWIAVNGSSDPPKDNPLVNLK